MKIKINIILNYLAEIIYMQEVGFEPTKTYVTRASVTL